LRLALKLIIIVINLKNACSDLTLKCLEAFSCKSLRLAIAMRTEFIYEKLKTLQHSVMFVFVFILVWTWYNWYTSVVTTVMKWEQLFLILF